MNNQIDHFYSFKSNYWRHNTVNVWQIKGKTSAETQDSLLDFTVNAFTYRRAPSCGQNYEQQLRSSVFPDSFHSSLCLWLRVTALSALFCFFLTWSNQMEINGNAAVKTSPSQSPLTSTVVTGAPTWASCDRNPSVMWSHSFSSMNTNVSRSSVKDGGFFCWNSLRSRFF